MSIAIIPLYGSRHFAMGLIHRCIRQSRKQQACTTYSVGERSWVQWFRSRVFRRNRVHRPSILSRSFSQMISSDRRRKKHHSHREKWKKNIAIVYIQDGNWTIQHLFSPLFRFVGKWTIEKWPEKRSKFWICGECS